MSLEYKNAAIRGLIGHSKRHCLTGLCPPKTMKRMGSVAVFHWNRAYVDLTDDRIYLEMLDFRRLPRRTDVSGNRPSSFSNT